MLKLQKPLSMWLQRDGGLTAAIVGGAAALGATGGQMYANAKMNKRAVAYNREAYARQRADALADWAMQNEYNSPRAQMQRFKEAGLNPNLIYGQMNEGATVRSTDMDNVNWQKHDIMPAGQAVADAFSNYQTWRANSQALKNAEQEFKNAEEQNNLIKSQIAQNTAQTANIIQQTTGHEFDLSQKQRLADTAFQTAQEALNNSKIQGQNMQLQGINTVALTDKIRTETGISLKDYQLREALNKKNVALAGEHILKTVAETAKTKTERDAILQGIENARKDGTIKQYEIELNKIGAQKSDNLLMRLINEMMHRIFGGKAGTPLTNPNR